MNLPTGFHQSAKVTKEEYMANPHAVPLLSASIAKILLSECPAKAWDAHPMGGKRQRPPTKCMVNGTCVDSLLMGGDTDLCVLPDEMEDAKGKLVKTRGEFRLESAKQWKDDMLALGKQPVGRAHFDEVTTAATAILAKFASLGFDVADGNDGATQVTAIWESDDVTCKARFDWLSYDGVSANLRDLKSMRSVHPERAAYAVEAFGYDVQAAAYIEAVETIHPELAGAVGFELLCCELLPPYECAIYPLSEGFLSIGRQKWARAKEIWKRCLATGVWPGYPSGTALMPPEGVIRKAIFAGYET